MRSSATLKKSKVFLILKSALSSTMVFAMSERYVFQRVQFRENSSSSFYALIPDTVRCKLKDSPIPIGNYINKIHSGESRLSTRCMEFE